MSCSGLVHAQHIVAAVDLNKHFVRWVADDAADESDSLEVIWLVQHTVDDVDLESSVTTRERTLFSSSYGLRIETRLESVGDLIDVPVAGHDGGMTGEQETWAAWAKRLESDAIRGSDGVLVTHYIHQGRFVRSPRPQESAWETAPGVLRRMPELVRRYLATLPTETLASLVQVIEGRIRVQGLPGGLKIDLDWDGAGYRVVALQTSIGSAGSKNLRWEFSWNSAERSPDVIRRCLLIDGDVVTAVLGEDRRVHFAAARTESNEFQIDLGGAVMHNPRTGEMTNAVGDVVGQSPGISWGRYMRSAGLLFVFAIGAGTCVLGLYLKRRWEAS